MVKLIPREGSGGLSCKDSFAPSGQEGLSRPSWGSAYHIGPSGQAAGAKVSYVLEVEGSDEYGSLRFQLPRERHLSGLR